MRYTRAARFDTAQGHSPSGLSKQSHTCIPHKQSLSLKKACIMYISVYYKGVGQFT